ncbi:hypothetical protein VKT23_001576 [Stygiomarasmius scandens]|uniref:Uncharacterized protein n=1 Tax=Marasmiellus scandens TaxID=2682957 RepID=A0ABR1K1D9_9AGAR
MTRILALVALTILVTAAASLHVPGCLPNEDATIVSESTFQVPDLNSGPFELILTYFTCPSRERALQNGTLKRRDQNLIEICGIMDSSQVFAGTFNCDQAPVDQPTIEDCSAIDDVITDSLIRPMVVTIPALSGLVVSLLNNSCAFVFLNDDTNDTYDTCLHTIPDVGFDITEECPQVRDGFIGSVRSPVQPGVQNWELHIISSSSLKD